MTHSRIVFGVSIVAGFALILGFQNCAKDPEGLQSPAKTARPPSRTGTDTSSSDSGNTPTPTPTPNPVPGAATIESYSVSASGFTASEGGFYDSQSSVITVNVISSNATNGVTWGGSNMTRGAAAGSAYNFSLLVPMGNTSKVGFYGELDVIAKGTTAAQNTTWRVASHCLASSTRCKLLTLAGNEVTRPRAIGPFFSDRTAANCGAGIMGSDGANSRSTFDIRDLEECVVFNASPGSGGSPQNLKCYYVGVGSLSSGKNEGTLIKEAKTIYYNENHLVPCNGGIQTKYIGNPNNPNTTPPDPINDTVYAAFIAVNAQTGLANKVMFKSVCTLDGNCAVSPVEAAYYSQTCAIPSGENSVTCN